MKLSKLIIKNFRGLKGDKNIIDFKNSDIIFLIGRNNTGKSTFLNAYDFFINPKQTASRNDFHNFDINIPIEIEVVFDVDRTKDENDNILKRDAPDWINKWVLKDTIKIKKIWNKIGETGQKYTFSPEKMEYVQGGFGGFDTLLKKYSPLATNINAILTYDELEKKINDIIIKNHIKKLETIYADRYNTIIRELQNLKDDISNSSDINEINRKMNIFFSEIFPELELNIYALPDEIIDLAKILKSTHGINVQKKEKNDSYTPTDIKCNGDGVFRQAFFSFLSSFEKEIDSTEKEYLILFEEPELYLHPEAQFNLRTQLYNLAKNSPYQFICSTHSSLMIDLEKPHSSLVRLVKEDDKTTTFQVNFDIYEYEDKNYLQMVNRFNPHICESFFSNKVLLVEGDTEAIFYRHIIKEYYNTISDLFILNTGSKVNIVFFQKILTHFGIDHVIIHDCDYMKVKNKKNKEIDNPMFTINKQISDQIIESKKSKLNISRRFVHFPNFETAHGYKENKVKGKPLSAFLFAQGIEKGKQPCFQFLDDLYNNNEIDITHETLIEKATKDFKIKTK